MSDRVTMKALDTMHISNVSAENLVEGDAFTVSETDAKRLEAAGLAERGGTAAKAVNAEAATSDRPDTREEIDADRGFKEGRVIGAASTFDHDGDGKSGGSLKGADSTSARGAAKRKGK